MSLIDLASLVLAPTATKEGKVYSAIPDTGEGDMTFTRGSAATRINSAGLIEKERGNLLLQSNTFDTTWTLDDVSVTSGQSGYDGSNNAWKLESTDSGRSTIEQSISLGANIVQTFSVYAKSGNVDFLKFIIVCSGSNSVVTFDLSDGSSTSTNNEIDVKSENVGNDWYRLSLISAPDTDMTSVRFEIRDSSGSSGSAVGSFVYIQDAMLNQGLVAQSYIETTTTAVYEGITDDVPRVDYSGGGCPSLLLEPQRTNLSVHSEYFEASNWTALRSTIALSSSTSPEGVLNAYKLTTDNTTNNTHIIYYGGTLSSDDYALSVYAKAGEFSKVGLGTGNLTLSAKFDLSNGSIITSGTHTAYIEDAGNGWYRCSIVTTTTTPIRIVLLDDDGNISFDGDGTSGLYIYGHQVEAGSYVSSYIPTYSVSSTRVADSCSKTGISELIGQTEGTIYWEGVINGLDNNYGNIITSERNVTTSFSILARKGGMQFQCAVFDGSTKGQCTGGSLVFGTKHKLAYAYKSGDFALYVDGVQAATSTQTWSPSGTIDDIYIADLITFFGYKEGNEHNQISLFPTRLTNDQLEELTT